MMIMNICFLNAYTQKMTKKIHDVLKKLFNTSNMFYYLIKHGLKSNNMPYHVIVKITNMCYTIKDVTIQLKFNHNYKNVQIMNVTFWCNTKTSYHIMH